MSPASGAGAGGKRLTISSMSCRGVKAFVPFQKPPLYAAVSLGGRREKTPPDADGGENPDWEGAVVAFDLDGREQQEEQAVQFEVKAQVPLLGTKVVGTASVPVAYLAAAEGAAAPQHVRYQVKAPDGKANGTLSFAYTVSSSGAGAGGARPQPQVHSVPAGAPPPKQGQSLGSAQPQMLHTVPAGAPPPKQGQSFGSAPPQPQKLHTVHDGAPSSPQGPSFCSGSAPPPPVNAYPAPTSASFTPHGHGGGYPPPPSPSAPPESGGSLYPPLQDLLQSSAYPSPPSTLPHQTMANPHFLDPNSSVYPPPAPNSASVYPPPPDSCIAGPAPPANYMSSYPPQQPSSYPPPPPSSYPPPASSYHPPPPSGYPSPASNFSPPTGAYPPPESGWAYPPVQPRSVDSDLPCYPAPSSAYPPSPGGSLYPPPPGGSLYPPPPRSHHHDLDGAGRIPYGYPPPDSRYP